MRRALLLPLLFAIACASDAPRVPFRVVVLGDDPFFGTTATAIAVTVERNGVRDASTTTRFSPTDRTLVLPPLPYATDYSIVVETELFGLPVGRGRSFPFAVTRTGADHVPDVSLGVLGRFASVAAGDASDPFVTIVPSSDGALLASAQGLSRFVAHGADARPQLLPRVAWPASRVGGVFAALGGAMLVVGGTAPGASLVDASGQVLAELGETELPIQSGVALTVIDAQTVLAIGGAHHDGTMVADVCRLTWNGTHLTATTLAPLPAPRSLARALRLDARTSAGVVEPRVLVYNGETTTGHATDVVLVDPAGHAAARAVVLPGPVTHAAGCALDTGLVLLAGGRDATTSVVTGQVTILVIQPDATTPIAPLSPPPPLLFRPRESAVALSLLPGIALVVGGTDDAGATIADAEIAEFRIDALPGSIVLTSSTPTAGNITAAARLLDHTVLVSMDGSLALYFSPRGE